MYFIEQRLSSTDQTQHAVITAAYPKSVPPNFTINTTVSNNSTWEGSGRNNSTDFKHRLGGGSSGRRSSGTITKQFQWKRSWMNKLLKLLAINNHRKFLILQMSFMLFLPWPVWCLVINEDYKDEHIELKESK